MSSPIPSRRKVLLRIAAGIAVLTLAVFAGRGGIANWLEGQSELSLVVKATDRTSYEVVLNETEIEAEIPAFHALMEIAYRTGVADTTDEALMERTWAYLDELRGTELRAVYALYNDRVFHIHHVDN